MIAFHSQQLFYSPGEKLLFISGCLYLSQILFTTSSVIFIIETTSPVKIVNTKFYTRHGSHEFFVKFFWWVFIKLSQSLTKLASRLFLDLVIWAC